MRTHLGNSRERLRRARIERSSTMPRFANG